MSRRAARILIVMMALIAHVAVHEWCDVSVKRWVVKGKLGRFGYEELDHDSLKVDRYSINHNSTGIFLGPFKLMVPFSVASLLLAQITVPIVVLSFMQSKRKRPAQPQVNEPDKISGPLDITVEYQ